MPRPSIPLGSLIRLVVGLTGAVALFANVQAQPASDPAVVEYVTSLAQVQEQIPFSRSIQVQIKAPYTLPATPHAIGFSVSSIHVPTGASADEAVGYVSFQPNTLSFNFPGQAQTVTITLSVPADAVPGPYGYKILATGWPVPDVGLVNLGTFINATITAPPAVQRPPEVVISTPADGSVISVTADRLPVRVPFAFRATATGDSAAPITSVTAELNGASVPLERVSGLQTQTVDGSGTLVIATPGVHELVARATNAGGTAATTSSFSVVVTVDEGGTIAGNTFFDVDFDGRQDAAEFGLGGVTVKLLGENDGVIARTETAANGSYSFARVRPGSYTISATAQAGLAATTLNERTIDVRTANACVPDIGFGLKFDALGAMKADGYSHGFWKSNLSKAIACRSKGAQVSRLALLEYTDKIGEFALSPYDGISMELARAVLESSSSNPANLLSKQLIASEYNYQHGAYINGDRTLTFLFLHWGEHILAHSSQYSPSYILWAKDWFDAYNNSHGGRVDGPAAR